MRYGLILLLILGRFLPLAAQSTEWLRVTNNPYFTGTDLDIIDSDNHYYTVDVYGQPGAGFMNRTWHLVKYAAWGDSLRQFELPYSVQDAEIRGSEIFLLSVIRGKRSFTYNGTTYSVDSARTSVFLFKLDTSLQLQRITPIVEQASFVSPIYPSLETYSGAGNELLLSLYFRDTLNVGGHRFLCNGVGEIGKAVWVMKDEPQVQIRWAHEYRLYLGTLNGEYLYGYDRVLSDGTARIFLGGKKGYYLDGNYVPAPRFRGIQDFDRNGNAGFRWHKEVDIMLDGYMEILSTGKLMFYFLLDQQSNIEIIPGIRSGTEYQWMTHVACFDRFGNFKWDRATDTLGLAHGDLKGYFGISGLKEKNGLIYGAMVCNQFNGSFGGFKVTNSTIGRPHQTRFVRFDSIGQVLWNFKLNEDVPSKMSFQIDEYANILLSIAFIDSFNLPDTQVFLPPGSNMNLAHAKLGSFAIYRGDVYAGPYCAGDTILIPFTIRGAFESGNEFIAELSDENGSFEQGVRELGRLTGNQSDTVKGLLPDFQVETSADYRIRLRSTAPPAQSFYRRDTLRLLVYSRDSADAGTDTLICYGQSIRLSTTGGSRWDWSPANVLNDSTLKRPIASPLKGTEFRIIISDSSGCGDTDTDYVYVDVRPPLSVDSLLTTPDTACIGQPVSVKAWYHGGDSSGYTFRWSSGNLELGDSNVLNYTTLYDTLLQFRLSDGCSSPADSLSHSITVRMPLSVSAATDSVCFTDSLRFTAAGVGGLTGQHRYTWYRDTVLLGEGNRFAYPADSVTYFRVRLEDGCTQLMAWDTVSGTPVPKAVIDIPQYQGCLPFMFTASLIPLNRMVYEADWQLGPYSDTGFSVRISVETKGNYPLSIVLNPGGVCEDTLYADSLVQVQAPPVADFAVSPDFLDTENPDFTIENRSSSGATSFMWLASDGSYSTLRTPQFVFQDTGWYRVELRAYSSFGCMDSTSQMIRIHDIYSIAIPNAFTPGNDQLNPVFAPVLTGFTRYKLHIYDRWGESLFQSENIPWDGTYQGIEVPAGLYLYRIDVTNERGNRNFYTGYVHVIR